jgi:hypothetical protein
VWIGCVAIALVEDIADNTAYLRGVLFVYAALTAIRKDCGRYGKKASARLWRDQADTHSNSPH